LVLQIAHVSDLHFYVPQDPSSRLIAAARALVSRVPFLSALLHKVAGHDLTAIHALEDALELVRQSSKPEEWAVSRLVCSGDLSTWGDDVSIEAALSELRRVAASLGLPAPDVIYGNHDVWSGTGRMPIRVAVNALSARRDRLRRTYFSAPWLQRLFGVPLGTSSPNVPAELALYSLNTILHGPIDNMLARGEVKDDLYWQHAGRASQLDELAAEAGQRSEVRLVLTHHPVCDPTIRLAGIKRLSNRGDVAKSIARPEPRAGGLGQIASVLLSGHTHLPHPRTGELGNVATDPSLRDPLALSNQLQLTTGTASQAIFDPEVPSQTWQLLRFWEDGTQLRLERIIFDRAGAGSFNPRAIGDSETVVAEEIVLPF
jgi:3',5'-cyclic AMP phosphodiesterase CpdA